MAELLTGIDRLLAVTHMDNANHLPPEALLRPEWVTVIEDVPRFGAAGGTA